MSLPVIILHGWGSSASAWDKPKKLFGKAGYLVLVPDLPGFGKEPPPRTAWSVADYADFVLEYAKKNEFDKFVLIGHSFGGRVAIKLTALYPERVTALILTGVPGVRFGNDQEKIKVWFFLPLAKLGNLCFNLPPFIVFRPLARKVLYWLAGARDYYQADTPSMKETFKKIVNEDLRPLLKMIKIPTLLLWGAQDRVVPPGYGQLLFKEIPGAKIKIVEKGSHCFPYEQPEIFVKEIVGFFI